MLIKVPLVLSVAVVKTTTSSKTVYLQLWAVARSGGQTPSGPGGAFLPSSRGARANPQAEGRTLYQSCQHFNPLKCAVVPRKSKKTSGRRANTARFSGSGNRSNGSLLEAKYYNNGNSRQTGCSGLCTHHPPHVKVEVHPLFMACKLLLCEPYCNTRSVCQSVEKYTPWDKGANYSYVYF